MTIASEIARLQTAKADSILAFTDKGVTIPEDVRFDDFPDMIDSISGGGADPSEIFPMPILNVDSTYYGTNGIKLRWTPPDCEGQRIAWKKNGLPTLPITENYVDVSKTTREYNLTNLDLDTQYGFWVLSKNSNGTFQTAQPPNNRKKFKTNAFLDTTVIEIALPAGLSAATTLYVFRTKSGDTYISGNNASSLGIYKLNKITQLWEQVYAASHSWQYWFESSDGRVFVSSSQSSTGIVSGTGGSMTQVYASSYNWMYWFESSSGAVFVSSTQGSTYIRKWDGATFSQVYSYSSYWQYWFEDSSGNVFVSSSNSTLSNPGILKWNGTSFVQVYSVSHSWQYWFEDSSGNVFVSSSGEKGILKWSGIGFESVYNNSYSFQYWFEDSKGNLFVGSSSNSVGILKWNGSIFEQVYSYLSYWRYWFEDSNSNVFVGSSQSSTGILKWTGTIFEQVYATGYGWQYWFEDSNKNVFVGSSDVPTNNRGILKLDGTVFNKVYSSLSYWSYWVESSDKEILVSAYYTDNSGILKWNGTAFTKIFSTGYNYDYIHETATEIIFINTLAASYPFAIYDKTAKTITASGSMYGGLKFGILPRFLNNTNKKLYTLSSSFDFIGNYTAVTNNATNYAYAVSTDMNYVMLNF